MLALAKSTSLKGLGLNFFSKFTPKTFDPNFYDRVNEEDRKILFPFLDYVNEGKQIDVTSHFQTGQVYFSNKAMKLTFELNSKYHTPEEIREIMSEITGHTVDPTFSMFPPFYTDFGKNIHFGKNVFINMGCKFQDQGGIYIGDDALIGHNAVMATLNHDMDPSKRGDTIPKPIRIGNKVWLGANVTILQGVTIGDNSIIAAGSIVKSDVPPNSIVAGVPGRVVKTFKF